MSTQASTFHRVVVEDVIKSIREDFINEGLDESVLEDLRQRWENKLMQIPHAYDLPGLATHNYSTYDMNNYNYMDPNSTLLPPLPQNPLYNMNPYLTPTTTQRTAAHNTAMNSLRTLSTLPSTTTTSTYYDPTGKPQPYLAPPSHGVQSWNTQPTLPVGLNTQYNPPNIRQQDGASDDVNTMTEIQKNDASLLKQFAKVQKQQQKIDKLKSRMPKTDTTNQDSTSSTTIPQFDGLGDKKEKDEDDEDDEEEGSPKGDEELGSDLDDEDDEDEPDTDYIVLCQYEKVTRVKNKRKANLKDGIMHINGKDYVFSKATGEFDW